MSTRTFRSAIVLASGLAALAIGSQAHAGAAIATNDAATDAGASTTTEDANDQATSANQSGQANDAQSLTTSDIIVTGSLTAQVAPITASLTTTQPQSARSEERRVGKECW